MNSFKRADNLTVQDHNSNSVPYMPQLDALRAFAVFFVLIQHWLTDRTWLLYVPFGMIGVTLFFVLSGFLISYILLQSKLNAEVMNTSILQIMKQFYIRRTLRIFPIYYITLIVLFIFNIENIRDMISWFVFYSSNIYFYLIHDWVGLLSHLWTLAVEEQFYILWPFIILFTPKKYLLKILIIIILLGPVSRSVLYFFSDGSELSVDLFSILMPTCMDCFGLGALLAYIRINTERNFQLKNIYASIFLLLNILFLIICGFFEENIVKVFFYRFSVSIISLFLIAKAASGFKGPLKRIFENKILLFLGKISYSIYLFHAFIPKLYEYFNLPGSENIYIQFLLQGTILTLISSLSWIIIEKPIIGLKRKFRYN